MIVSSWKLTRTLLLLVIAAFLTSACGSEREAREPGEHMLSEQQQALEQSKAAAEAMEKAAAQRAAQSAPQQ